MTFCYHSQISCDYKLEKNMVYNYSNMEIFDLFVIHGECNRVVDRTCRQFNQKYRNLPQMTRRTFRRIKANFLEYGSTRSKEPRRKPVTADEINEINTLAYFHGNPQGSIQAAANDLGLTFSSIQRILKKHRMHNFSFKRVQMLYPNDYNCRVQFCEEMLIKTQEDANFLKKIIWTDEAKFSEEGVFNRQNLHHWSDQNPHVIRKTNVQRKFSFNVFCMILDNMICYHIYDGNLNSVKYLEILQVVVGDFLDNLPLATLRNCWYQLDGAPAHCSNQVLHTLNTIFEDRWIGRFGPWKWPARSPDLTPLDFYLWGRIKDIVYKTPVESKEELQQRTILAFETLNPIEIRHAATNGVHSRLLKCLNVEGQHFEK